MDYQGVIIEESLENKELFKRLVKILSTKVETVTEKHQTPWINQWTLHTVEISDDQAENIANKISQTLDKKRKHSWYADFKNDQFHFIIFRDKVFKVERGNKEQYAQAMKYGISLGIPEYQVNFSPDIKEWKR